MVLVLAQIRSIQMIVHLMIMNLQYPPVAVIFFDSIFEYATFDFIPTEEINAKVFKWENKAINDSAEAIGYES